MQYLRQTRINASEDGTASGISSQPVGNHRLHWEAQEILPPSQRCCCGGDVTAGPEGLICASGKELRNKAASRFRIAGSSSPHVLCCTCSLCLASEEFYFWLYRDVNAQPSYLALGMCTATVTSLSKNAKKRRQ